MTVLDVLIGAAVGWLAGGAVTLAWYMLCVCRALGEPSDWREALEVALRWPWVLLFAARLLWLRRRLLLCALHLARAMSAGDEAEQGRAKKKLAETRRKWARLREADDD